MNDLGGVAAETSLDMSGAACLTRARALIPLLRKAADRIDAANELPDDVLDAMFEARMFKLLLPKSLGGAELTPVEYVQCVEAIAEGDASTAWCMNQGSGCSMASAYVDPAVAREVWGGPRDVLAWGQGPKAKTVRAPGGWSVHGSWSFASGSRHATWLGAMCPSFETDGAACVRPDGKPWERTPLFRREKAKIDDVWGVMGLRGTGSDTYAVDGLIVDEAHTVTREYAPHRREKGYLYRFQSMQLYAGGFASVALGVARAMLDAFIELAKTKSQAWSSEKTRDNHAIQNVIGYWDAAWKAARAGLHLALRTAWDDVVATGELSLDQKVNIRQATTYAIHASRDLCHAIFHEAGSTAIFNNQPFERRLRDINSVSQQTQGRRTHFETVGLYRLGGEPDLKWL
ncbi:MAG TPA: acyl-CoA dehydrogenase family protein [Rhodopila sp.]|nr:acyl-CoA dehydrogenase family protein [Rhodopila sp.]